MEQSNPELNKVDKGHQLYVYIDGQYYKEQDAKISIFDHLVLYGDGVFDTCCAWNGKIFKLDQHISRLYYSAHSVGISIPLSKQDFKEAIIKTVRQCKLQNGYIKFIVTRGVGTAPLLDPRNCNPSIIIFARPSQFLIFDPDKSRRGIKCKTSSIRRIPDQCLDSKVKCCNYLNHVLMRMEAFNSGADDAIALTTDGFVAEAPGYNIFIVKDGRISAPSENILLGITRETVIEIARNIGINIFEVRLTVYDIYVADEVFFSSTAGGIIPVVELDSRIIGGGQPGPITLKIQAAYVKMLEEGIHGSSIY